MKLHRFYIDIQLPEQGIVELSSPSLIHQLRSVFRFGPDDSIVLFDDSGFEYVAHIVTLTQKLCVCNIDEKRASSVKHTREVHLYLALAKREAFELAIEKATELGVSHIIPVLTERSEKKSLNTERARRITIEACEQSGRTKLPILEPMMTLVDAIAHVHAHTITHTKNTPQTVMCFDPRGTTFNPSSVSLQTPVSIFIGPEGGWSDAEIAVFAGADIDVVSVGQTVLRTETAVIGILSLLLL